jgi:dipeptidyl aminopeptidase/acylaminoacyl peptidase
MTRPTVPYGAWPSPFSLEMAVAGSSGPHAPWFDGEDLYWLESRPDEGGRLVVVRRGADGSISDLTPPELNARTRVHEYGGGSYTVDDGLVVFSNFADGRLYLQRATSQPEVLTPATALRYADLRIDRDRQRVLCVVEDHRSGDHEPTNTIGAVSLADGSLTTLASGADFFADPRLDVSGERLTWLRWDRPNMPWDGCELWVGHIAADGSVAGARVVAGGRDESIVQPEWQPDGSLVFASDRSGWWNLYRWREGATEPAPLAPMEAEFAGPQWVFGHTWFAGLADGRLVAVARVKGRDHLYVLAAGTAPREIETAFTELGDVVSNGARVAFLGGEPTQPSAVAFLDVDSGNVELVRRAVERPVGREHFSLPELMEFPTSGGRTAFAFFYSPTNPDVDGDFGERPPLIVFSHGGPTSNTGTDYYATAQFFATRGFAVVDVDYGGSTGYGRDYRRRLDGQWGIVDLEDCTRVASWLAEQGLVDGTRMAIRGGSAGGYTTLCALCFGDTFAAGASYFGVGDLEGLARDTHKFESRYLDRMVAPYPERVDVYRERSPIHFVDRIRCPVLVLQGTDDKVVPQAQADELVAALERNGLPYSYVLFEGEGHGFRKAENMRRALESEVSFYAQIFGFELAGEMQPVRIENLEAWKAAPSS